MNLKITPSNHNAHPLMAVLIIGTSMKYWLLEMQKMKLDSKSCKMYPVAGVKANSIFGCLITSNKTLSSIQAGKHPLYQMVSANLFIPEKSSISPSLNDEHRTQLFSSFVYLYHPELGLVELPQDFSLKENLIIPDTHRATIQLHKPSIPVFIPNKIQSFQVKAAPPEEAIKKFTDKITDGGGNLKEKPLSKTETIKMNWMDRLFKSNPKTKPNPESESESSASSSSSSNTDRKKSDLPLIPSIFGGLVFGLASLFSSSSKEQVQDQAINDLDELKRRNQDEVERLLDMLKNDPANALKYAIPLDQNNSNRGTSDGSFQMTKRWDNLSSRHNQSQSFGGSGSINLGDGFRSLEDQYHNTAKDLIEKGDYEKAAFIYLQLLKNYGLAANTLKDGEIYQEAAIIFQDRCKNKNQAAECYELGKMYNEAIQLHNELDNHEKCGDLYSKINKSSEASEAYNKAIEHHTGKAQFLEASKIARHKQVDADNAQKLLLDGWTNPQNHQKKTCLTEYFYFINDPKEKTNAFKKVHTNTVNNANASDFLDIVSLEYKEQHESNEELKTIGYKIISEYARQNSELVFKLKSLSKGNGEINRDISRFLKDS